MLRIRRSHQNNIGTASSSSLNAYSNTDQLSIGSIHIGTASSRDQDNIATTTTTTAQAGTVNDNNDNQDSINDTSPSDGSCNCNRNCDSISSITTATTTNRNDDHRGSIGTITTTRSRRSIDTIETQESSASNVDEKLNVFIDFFRSIVAAIVNDNKYYTYQILQQSKLLHKNIGTLSQLLGFGTEEKTTAVLLKAGLLRRTRYGVGIDATRWKMIEANTDDFELKCRFGNKKQNLFTIGRRLQPKGYDITTQIKARTKPPILSESTLHDARDTFSSLIGATILATAAIPDTVTTFITASMPTSDAIIDAINDASSFATTIDANEKQRTLKLNHGNDWITTITTAKKSSIEFAHGDEFDPIKKRNKTRTTDVNGRPVSGIENGYKVVHKVKLKTGEKSHETIKRIREVTKKGKITLAIENVLIAGTWAARFPQVPDVSMEQALAMGGSILASELGIGNTSNQDFELNFDNISTILPSRTTIGNHVKTVAAHKIILNGARMLKAKANYLSTDHGGGVLCKLGYFWCALEEKVIKISLDFDKAGHDAKGGGEAIKHSMKKYVFDDDQVIKFKGGSSDSGGGFTNQAMMNSLVAEGLADPMEYIFVACTEHNDQTALRNGVNNCYGAGGLDSRNVCQLIHSFSDIQQSFDGGTEELLPLMKSEWQYVRGSCPPPEFLKMMQEPILTRWKTVGEACQYVCKYLDVLMSFCRSLLKSGTAKAHSATGKTASNFLSLANEKEIETDLAFLSDFDKEFFVNHMEFNRATAKNIGSSGFIPHHHLVRYYIKVSELEDLKLELEMGSIDSGSSSVGPKLKNFWLKLTEHKQQQSLEKAISFIDEFVKSIHKHNKQFISPSLLFLACFGEHTTSTLVAKLFEGSHLQSLPTGDYQSSFHNKTINLPKFYHFIMDHCEDNINEAKTTDYERMKEAIRIISEGNDIWDGDGSMEPHRTQYLEYYAALPSTSVYVERAVKKAKQCQKTGKGERNVTAYGIAGDDINEMCILQTVPTVYIERMKKRRRKNQGKALLEGRDARSKKEYEEDLSRGPSLTRNILNHAYKLLSDINKMKEEIGDEEYTRRFKKTETMLRELSLQGSYTRYSARLAAFEANRESEYRPSAREKENGVDQTALMCGKTTWGDMLAQYNMDALRAECHHRGILYTISTNWTSMKKAVNAQEVEHWIRENPNKEIPDGFSRHFRKLSGATFVFKSK